MKSESSDESYLNGHSSGDMPNNHVNGNIPSLRSPSTSEEPLIPKADQAVKPIAIIGMSCRFPGDCTNPDELWNMISEGRSGWSSIPSDRFNQEAFYHPSSDMTGTLDTKGGHFLREDLSLFDAPFFNISPAEAKAMDPQQRLPLELAYEAIENAGISLETIAGTKTAVFTALFDSDYNRISSSNHEDIPTYSATGTGSAIQANRLSHFFDLRGPSMMLDTGCSGSLVAFHLACQSILAGESEQAIVGGANLILDPQVMIQMSMMKFFSQDGRCYSFDDRCSGYGRGEGVACVVLKPLDEAIAAGDPIRAVVRSSCVNQDGRTPGLTNPSQSAQEDMIRTAYSKARLNPLDTGYVEAHGTGTPAGDPVEAAAISAVFRESEPSSTPILVGSVKTNIGHTEATSGLAGLIKAVLTLEKGLIPPSINFEKPNQTIASQGLKIRVAQHLQPWPSESMRRVSINSFGYGGTNAHLILDDAKDHIRMRHGIDRRDPTPHNGSMNGSQLGTQQIAKQRARVFVMSSKSKDLIAIIAAQLNAYLEHTADRDEELLLDDLAFTLASRRSALTWRTALSAVTVSGLREKLQQLGSTPTQSFLDQKIAFVFTGQGVQWHAMGRELIHTYPVFEHALTRAAKILTRLGAPWDLLGELQQLPKTTRVHKAAIGQPLCTAIQLALNDLLESWNVRPAAVVGHSSGEIAAAYACGALDFDSAMTVSYHRGVLADTIGTRRPELRGAMLAVGLSEQEALNYIARAPQSKGKLVVACINSPSSVTISGDRSAILGLQSTLEIRRVFVRRLGVSTAYHSHHMEYIADEYRSLLQGINPSNSDAVEFFSSVTGKWMSGHLLDGSYWVRNMVSQVRFSDAVSQLCDSIFAKGRGTILEVGPHAALAGPVKQTVASLKSLPQAVDYLSTLLRDQDAVSAMLGLAGEVFARGGPINLDAVNTPQTGRRRHVLTDLPTYPWAHTVQHWHESRISQSYRKRVHPRHHLLGVQCPDSSSDEPRWSHRVRVSELPWIVGHVVQSSIVYPAAGYIAMALEASRQYDLSRGRGLTISSYELRNITIGKALIVPDDADGAEIVLCLRPDLDSTGGSSQAWNEFCVSSYLEKDGWSQHCRGLITVKYENGTTDAVEGNREKIHKDFAYHELFAEVKARCQKKHDSQEFYSKLDALGLQYQQLFTSLDGIRARPWESLGRVTIPDSAAVMPEQFERPHILHPASLDSCFQLSLAAIMEAGALNQTMVPTFIESVSVSSEVSNRPGSELQVHCAAERAGHRGFRADIVVVETNDTAKPVIEISGMKSTSIGGGVDQHMASAKSRRICHKIHWAPDVERLCGQDIQYLCSAKLQADDSAEARISTLRAASYQFIKNTLHKVSEDQLALDAPYMKRFYDWLKDQTASDEAKVDLSESAQTVLFDRAQSSLGGGALLCRVGHNLPRILRGEVDPLSLMVEDDLLSQCYHEDEGRRRNCAQVAAYADLLAHKHPDLKILEIGAGTASTTLPLLEALGKGYKRRFGSYTFTDISSAFFEKAEELLKDWSKLLSFQRLDIEKSPQEQGFKDGYYDLVVAGNIFHATSNIENTARNVRGLLRPGGKLILIEGTRPAVNVGLIFGTLPGWWLGIEDYRQNCPLLSEDRWHKVLRHTGYSGVDSCVPDYQSDEALGDSVLISTAIEEPYHPDTPAVDIICSDNRSSQEQELATWLSRNIHTTSPKIESLNNLMVEDKVYICLLEVNTPVLKTADSEIFQKLKALASAARGILWITQGGTNECMNPEAALITGLARTIRNESSQIRFVTLDLDPCREAINPDNQKAILDCLRASFNLNAPSQGKEHEYAVRKGQILVPRFVEDVNLIDYVNSNTNSISPQPETQGFFQENRPLKLEVAVPGTLDSLRFIDDPTAKTPLAADEIRIELRAAGVNFRDVLVSMGQLENSTRMAGECSGVVTAVGHDMQNSFGIGDRVCGWGQEAYASSVRLKGKAAKKIPYGMDFEVAASIPIVWTTAYYALVYLARLDRGESVLIHSAAGGVGQAAIMLARHIGARVFVTVGNEKKKAFLMEAYSIHEEHIFSSRLLSFSDGIKRLTDNLGVDVVLNSLAGESIRASCECLAPLGRFIEIGKRDILTNSRLEMAFFDRNVTFASVDLTVIFENRIAFGGWLLDQVFDLISQGCVAAVSPINRMSISDIEDAFRLIQTGKHMGKVVLSADATSTVKALPSGGLALDFSKDASYLIVGGLGGLGRVICQWMADQGAKNIIVLSRSGLKSDTAQQFAAGLEKGGTRLVGLGCDVSDPSQLESALASVSELPPIRGVIQAAMVLKDSFLENMTIDGYQDVIRPKVHGTMNLYKLLSKQPLDFFVNLSSIAGLGGNPAQGNYASASTFQDAFARSNTNQGMVMRSLDLGMIEGAGYVSENPESVKVLLSQGYTAVKLDELLAMITYAITTPISDAAPSQLIIGLSRQETTEFDMRLLEPKFSHLRVLETVGDQKSTAKDQSSLSQMLGDASSLKHAAEIVCTALVGKVSKLLAIPVDSISSDQAISTYGADSLVSVELRNWFSTQLEADVPVLEILGSKPMSVLAADAVEKSKVANQAVSG